jgi:L-threonylcarbamoyladenylate synthase
MAQASAIPPRIFNSKVAGEEGLAAAVEALARGELVAMPTETVYGLAADATNPAAVGRIYLAKGRPRFNPLIVHASSAAEAMRHVRFNRHAERLADAFWPGPMTLVLPLAASAEIADLVTAGLDTLAVRVPAHPVAQALLAACARPLAAPSANRSGHVSPTTATHVVDDLGDRVSVILDAGPTSVGLESTIIGLAGDVPVLLRAGGLARSAIEAVLGRPLGVAGSVGNKPAAPGMLASHYAPAAGLRLYATDVREGEGLLAFGPDLPAGVEKAVAMINLSPSGDLAEAASRFFAALRTLDRQAETIAVMPIPEVGLGEAINDRLRRAAAPRD